MSETATDFDRSSAEQKLEEAAASGKLSPPAVENIRRWLSEPQYAEYAPAVAEHLADEKFEKLNDVFWTIIPFGTGGRRGRMYDIGTNAINDRTIGESAQGLANYAKQQFPAEQLSCAIAYDTRHRSRHFAELCAGIMVAAGFKVYFLDDYRSTPELSFLVRYKKCTCGIMVTASHNPPSDNAVKVYWSTGGQVLPPHDKAIIDNVMSASKIEVADFQQALDAGDVEICTEEVDKAFIDAVVAQRLEGPRDLKVIYSPLHGVGSSAVCPVMAADGFTDVEVFGPHAEPSGDFPNVPGHVSNPENPAVFDAIIERAKEIQADLVMASDPDCDRLGCAAPKSSDRSGEWGTFTGNQIGVLLTDYVLSKWKESAKLSPENYIVMTLVTTQMARRIADCYGVKTFGQLPVGFKWIGQVMDLEDPTKFVLGTEESHGYLVGTHVRDKDGAVAAMLLAELAAGAKADGKTLHEKLDDLYWQHGYHAERLLTQKMEGQDGMERMQRLMTLFRQETPREIAGLQVKTLLDYQTGRHVNVADGTSEELTGPTANMVILELEGDLRIAVRPSGTEPKVKFYEFAYVPAEQLADLEDTKQEVAAKLDKLEGGLHDVAARV